MGTKAWGGRRRKLHVFRNGKKVGHVMGLSQLPGVSLYGPNTIPYEVNIEDTRFGGGFQEHKRRVRIACEPQSLEPREIEKAATRDQSQNQEPTPKSKRSIDPKRPCSEEMTRTTLKSLRLSM